MSTWVRYSITAYIGLLIAGSAHDLRPSVQAGSQTSPPQPQPLRIATKSRPMVAKHRHELLPSLHAVKQNPNHRDPSK